ncbi:hypothetical protein DFP73DRAFT_524860 [Morchella snyderi]|nr:hypothetical protein DFP73DRAFT_524860 [Morchella snyderi]
MKLGTYSYRFTAPHPPPAAPTVAPEIADNSDMGEMDEPHFFPMVARQYLSASSSTTSSDDDNDSGIGTLADNTIPPKEAHTGTGSQPIGLGINVLSTYDPDLIGLAKMHCKSPSSDWTQYPPLESEIEMKEAVQESEAPKTPVRRPPGGGSYTTPRRRASKSSKGGKRLSVIHEAVGSGEEREERNPRSRIQKNMLKRVPGLSKYEFLRLKAERSVKAWRYGSPQKGKTTIS